MKKTSMLLGNTLSAYLVINQHLRTMYTFCSCQSLHTKIWAKNVLYFQVITMYISGKHIKAGHFNPPATHPLYYDGFFHMYKCNINGIFHYLS